MKDTTKVAFLTTALENAAVWTAASAAIGYAIKRTGSVAPLVAFLFVPRFTCSSKSHNNDLKEN